MARPAEKMKVTDRKKELIQYLVRSESSGPISYREQAEIILQSLFQEFTTIELLGDQQAAIELALRAEVNRASMEKAKFDQCDLFSDEFLRLTVKVDKDHYAHMRFADASILTDLDKRKYEHRQKVNESYANWQKRYQKLMTDGGMADDPGLLVKDAVQRLKGEEA